jgi:DNA-binding transcriptional regulator GbsR (MarR family)
LNVQNSETFVPNDQTFIDRMGLAAEADGLSRIAGRLFGALLLESEPRSLDDLAEQLEVSKASVSTEARRLLDRGVAERIGKPGDRRDYYTLTPDFFAQIVRFRLGRWSALHRLAREMQSTTTDLPRAVRDRFAYIDDVHAFVLARVEEALREWNERIERATSSRERRRGARQKPAPKQLKRQQLRDRLG